MVQTRELPNETKKSIIKLLQEGNSIWSVAKRFGCSQSGVPKIFQKQNGKVIKRKHKVRTRKV